MESASGIYIILFVPFATIVSFGLSSGLLPLFNLLDPVLSFIDLFAK